MLRKVLVFVSAIGCLVIAFVAGGGSVATATQGQAVIAGADNSETTGTTFCNVSQGVCGGFNGGGAYRSVLINSLVFGNSSSSSGAGTASCVLSNCTIAYNSVYGTDEGGALYSDVNLTMTSCTVTGNINRPRPFQSGNVTGGVYAAAITKFTNCIVAKNGRDLTSSREPGSKIHGATRSITS